MTDDMQRVLADIIERHIIQTPCGTGFLTDPSKVDWRGVIADLRREAARSASGAEHMQWCSYAQDKTADCDCSAVTAAPAPAETTTPKCEHPSSQVYHGFHKCVACGAENHFGDPNGAHLVYETTGPAQPVSEPACILDQRMDLNLHDMQPCTKCEHFINLNVRECPLKSAPVPTLPDAAQGKARECRHVLDSSSGDQRCIRCDQPVLLPRLPETPGPQPVSEPARAAGGEDGQSKADQAQTGPSLSGVPQGKPAVALGAPPVPTPPDAAQGKPHIHDWQRLGPNPGDGWACECGNSRLDSDLHTTTGESGLPECLGGKLHEWVTGTYLHGEKMLDNVCSRCFLIANTRSTPRAMEGDARETWAFIERVLVEECGLLADQGLASQRENFIGAIANQAGDELLKAASDFLAVSSLARVRVAGRMMSREDVSAAIAGRRVGTEGDAT